MSNYCTHCGSQLEEGAKFCVACGATADETNGGARTSQTYGVGQQVRSNTKLKLIIPIAAVAVILSIVLCIALFGGGSYKGVVRKVVAAIEAQDVDALVELSSDLYSGNEDLCELQRSMILEDLTDLFSEEVGRKYSLKYKIDSVETMTEREKNDLLDDFASWSSWSYYTDEKAIDAVEEITEISVILTAKVDRLSKEKRVTILLAKENGGWKLFSMHY